MIENFQGKIISDADVSLPQMEDYFYNSLTPFIDQDKKDSESIFYIENPPDGEDAVGMSADGTIFTIKTGPGYNISNSKSAITIPKLSIYTGMNSPYSLGINTARCDVGDNAQNKEYLAQLTNTDMFKNYVKGRYGKNTNIADIKLRLLYTDGPKLPKYSTEWLEKKYIKKHTYKEVKNGIGTIIDSNTHMQPFQAEFDRNNGALSLDIEPAIRAYTDSDEVYIYNNAVQVWPYEATTINNNPLSPLDSDSLPVDYLNKKGYGYTDEEEYYKDITQGLTKTSYDCSKRFRKFSDLDKLGRCGVMVACLTKNEDFPKNSDGDRDSISTVKPSGWHDYSFKSIATSNNPNGILYNRCHLLMYAISGEGNNSKNLVTGTYALNQAMLTNIETPLKKWMEKYPDKKVLYRVTPVYDSDENLVPKSIKMEAINIDDCEEKLDLHGEVFNLQKDIVIYYKTGEAWQYGDISAVTNQYAKFYVLNNNKAQLETINLGLRLRNEILKKVMNAQDSRICVSVNGLTRRSDYTAPYDPGFLEPATPVAKAIQQAMTALGDTFYNDDEWFKYSGFNIYGLDAYGRSLGVVYLKQNDGQWINLNKYVIWYVYNSQTVKQSNFIPDNLTFEDYYKDPTGERFKSWTYDIENINYQDNFWTQMKTLYGQDERREEIQKEVFKLAGIHPNINSDTKVDIDGKKNMNCLKDWTISIGDVSFFCPPSAIRVITQTMTERLPLLRAKGSMAKNIEKADTEIELSLFFNNEYGINGQAITIPIWKNKDAQISPLKKIESDEKATYYMNGLRALIAEFKFTPFLPVVNTYLNRTLKIAAVSLEQIDIQTVPNFPKLLKATLRMKNFDYNVYMPQVPGLYVPSENSDTNEVENPFSLCINYDVMRYYYQKPLQYGNELAAKLDSPKESGGYSINSVEFVKDTLMKNRSVLLPCKFMDPNIDIYIANEDYLKRLMSIKKDAVNRATTGAEDNYIPTSDEENIIREISNLWIDYGVGETYNKYSTLRNNIVTAYKQSLPPANKDFEITIGDIKYIGSAKYNKHLDGKTCYLGAFGKEELKAFVKEHVCDAMYKELQETLRNKKNIDGENLVKEITQSTSGSSSLGSVNIKMNASYTSILNVGEKLWEQYKKETKSKVNYPPTLFRDGIINLDLSSIGYKLTSSDPSETIEYEPTDLAFTDFLTWCSANAATLLNANNEAQMLKEAMDWENAKTIQYDLVAEDVRVDLFESSMANNFARISLLDSDGHASQYMGSSDIHISWKITTKSEEFAMTMKRLPEYEAYCMREYHQALPCFPIKIDSEFTRMLGVFEVSIEDVIINTVPNQPELYDIQVRAISVDRTLRNREALKSVDNQTDTNANGQSGELNDKTLTHASTTTKVTIKTFDNLSEKLAQAEVYPDLELPTIGELGKKGFIFLRYKEKARDKDDLFVDPDFYFYYPYSTMAEIMRNTIQANFNGTDIKNVDTAANQTIVLSDNQGNTGINFSTKDNKVNIDNANDEYKNSVEKAHRDKLIQSANLANLKNLDVIKALPAAFIGDLGKWDISTALSVSFTESYYIGLKQLKDSKKEDTTTDTSATTDAKTSTITGTATASTTIDTTASRETKLKQLQEFYDDKMSTCDKAVDNLYKYLKENPIDRELTKEDKDINHTNSMTGTLLSSNVSSISSILGEYKTYLEDLYINTSSMKNDTWDNFILSAADMYTGMYEYNTSLSDEYWQGRYSRDKEYLGTFKNSDNKIEEAKSDTDFDKMKTFGPLEIKSYNYQELYNLISEDERKDLTEYLKEKTSSSDKVLYLLDPYYRYQSYNVQKTYLRRCQYDAGFAYKAFFRIIMWWLAQLYKADLFPSISMDLMRRSTKNNANATKKAKELIEKEYGKTSTYVDETLLTSIQNFVEENGPAFDNGKIFCAVVMAIYDMPLKDNPFYSLMIKRDYDALNRKLLDITSESYKNRKKVEDKDYMFRKFILALCGHKEIKSPSFIGRSKEITPAARFLVNHNIKIALEASADPAKWLFHSYYDMLRADYRGRMLRAFPTFYCVFMDEGKEIGLWKLHDNFYSINSIIDISIVKSRKIAADTCTMVLSNNYSTFTTDDEDGYTNYKDADFGELWDSIFHKKEFAYGAEQRRLAANKINKAKLQPGIRIHVREGYGSDARELSGVFNGVISEVTPNAQAIQIVAQGNGIELMNPLLEDRDGDEIQYKDQPGDWPNNTDGGGASPATILKSFLTCKGGFLAKYFQGQYSTDQLMWKNGVEDPEETNNPLDIWANWVSEVWATNAYGISHFGDPNYKDVFPGGEIIQNIYEVSSLPNMAQDGLTLYEDSKGNQEPPYLSFETQGKTFWDVMHICKSVAPDYITGTASFGFRDTIFFGKPQYYYAYDYQKYNGVYVEKRKPFRQFHYVFSNSDIISNNITASSDKIRTVATGLYKDQLGTGLWSYTRNKDVGPLYVDKNIYPEFQKSTFVDTRLKMKSATLVDKGFGSEFGILAGPLNTGRNFIQTAWNLIPPIGWIQDLVSFVAEDYAGSMFDGTGKMSNHKRIAWSSTADLLKESVKEMYQGEITIIGSPGIKPHDRLFIKDHYNDITGSVAVRDVVHNLSASTGFTTTIHVDTVSTVDDKDELKVQNAEYFIGAQITLAVVGNVLLHFTCADGIATIDKWGKEAGEKLIQKTAETINIPKALERIKVNPKNALTAVKDAKILKALKYGGTTLLGVATVATGGAAGIAAFIAMNAAKYIITDLIVQGIMGNINDWLLYTVKDHRVLQIFPLKKNGMVYTAGLEGNLGLVYGSPTYGQCGPLEKIFGYVFADSKEDGNVVAQLLRECLVSPELRAEASKYSQDLNHVSKIGASATTDEAAINSIAYAVDKEPGFKIHKKNSFDMSLGNRVIIKNKDNKEVRELKNGYSRYYIEKIDDILLNSNKKNQLLIIQYKPLAFYKRVGYIEILHDKIGLSENTKIKHEEIEAVISGEKTKINGIRNNNILDVPFLSKDGLIVLKDICDHTFKKLEIDNTKDDSSIEKALNGTKLIVTSALMVGSSNMMCSSGYSFALRGTGSLDNGNLKKYVEEYRKELQEKLDTLNKEDDQEKYQVCWILGDKSTDTEIRINIMPESPIAKQGTTSTTKETTTK